MNKRVSVTVERLTSWELAAECARVTVWKSALDKEPSDNFKKILVRSEHSPLRTLVYKVRMENIPSFVSVHLVRHKYGVEHFVSSNRPDRNGGNTDIGRWSPVNHIMVVNAQELLFMARRRLCNQASRETRWVMKLIKEGVRKIDPIVASAMVPMCIYRGTCPEPVSCGHTHDRNIMVEPNVPDNIKSKLKLILCPEDNYDQMWLRSWNAYREFVEHATENPEDIKE